MAQGSLYEIRVAGQLGKRWAHWFEDLEISGEGEPAITTLQGTVADQAALLGLLYKLYTLGLPLLLVQRQDQA
jgi:hypothetical protein